MDLTALLKLPEVTQSTNPTLQKDLYNAWASVFYNSSSSVASVLDGVPVIALDEDCVAWNVASHSLEQIETPVTPDREQWLHDLCAAHWSDGDGRNGSIYQKFLPYL
jgi:hypothetical protein